MKKRRFAKLSWCAEDVMMVDSAGGMNRAEAEQWLKENQNRIRDRLCELGFEVINDLLAVSRNTPET